MDLLSDDSQERGNACMKENKYIEAMIHYTRGIKIDPQSPHLYSNRSLAFLHMEQYYHALEDAKTAIRMMPKWAKGYFRKGEIECAAEHYADAVESYKKGLALMPGDTSLQNALAKATSLWMNQRRVENRIPWYGLGLGAVVGILLIVLDEGVATKNPIFSSDLIRTAVLVAIMAACLGFAMLYRFFMRSQRHSLLESPPDLFGDDFLSEPAREPAATVASTTSAGSVTSLATHRTVQRPKKSHR